MPRRIVLDIDVTFDRVQSGQRLRLSNAFHDDYGYQPIIVFDGERRFVTALLQPGQRPSGKKALLRRLIGALRVRWPRVEILVRADNAAPKCSTGAAPTGWITSWIWHQTPRYIGM